MPRVFLIYCADDVKCPLHVAHVYKNNAKTLAELPLSRCRKIYANLRISILVLTGSQSHATERNNFRVIAQLFAVRLWAGHAMLLLRQHDIQYNHQNCSPSHDAVKLSSRCVDIYSLLETLKGSTLVARPVHLFDLPSEVSYLVRRVRGC